MRVYHGTDRESLRPGTIMRPSGTRFVRSSKPSIRATEVILEAARLRMADILRPRKQSVFAVLEDNPLAVGLAGGLQSILLECETLGGIPECSDAGWWSAVNILHTHAPAAALDGWAEAYWMGIPFDEDRIRCECGVDLTLLPRAYSITEVRCAALEILSTRDPSSGWIGAAELRTWGIDGDRLSVIIDPDDEAAAALLSRSGVLQGCAGRAMLVLRNERNAAATLRSSLLHLAATRQVGRNADEIASAKGLDRG